MSERLIKLVNDALIKSGVETLRDCSGLTVDTIRKIADGHRTPHRRTAYKLAKACGATDENALAMAYECPKKAKKAG